MPRAFQSHLSRHVDDLAGLWDFAYLGEVDFDSVDPDEIRFDDRMAVPGSFDATPRYAGRRGVAAYRRRVQVQEAGRHHVVIDGLHHYGRIYLGGGHLGDHIGGFTRFQLEIDDIEADEHDLVILTDNRIDYDRCPLHLDYFDWYHYGGITRGVELHRLGPLWIEALITTTVDLASREVELLIQYRSDVEGRRTVPLKIFINGRTLIDEQVTITGAPDTIDRLLELKDHALWSPDQPELHTLRVCLGEDDMVERIGIRTVRAEGRSILINEEPVTLRGFNRHESHPQFGHGLPDAMLVSDLQQIRDMGCNFIRGSHYPQDRRFLDLCDEFGILVWNEIIGWQHTAEHLNDSGFIDAQLTQANEMVMEAINHPSVIMWGLLNESDSHQVETRLGYEALTNHLRDLDPSRLVTYATNKPFEDRHLDLCDIVSVNAYPGWYGGRIEDIPAALDRIAAHLDDSGHGNKPLIISEIGGGGIYGWRDWHEDFWTEQYQAKLLEMVIHHMFTDRDRYAGLAIWQFCDLRTMPSRAMGRPRMFNNKGVVDEYRRPKLAYHVVKQGFENLLKRG